MTTNAATSDNTNLLTQVWRARHPARFSWVLGSGPYKATSAVLAVCTLIWELDQGKMYFLVTRLLAEFISLQLSDRGPPLSRWLLTSLGSLLCGPLHLCNGECHMHYILLTLQISLTSLSATR